VLLVTEGIPDALTAAGAGYAAVGILGSQAPDDRVAEVLVRNAGGCGRELVAIVDADTAGRAWGARLAELLTARNHPLEVVEPPPGLDLNAWALTSPGWMTALAPELQQPTSAPETRLDHLAP
jgi:DNA primase